MSRSITEAIDLMTIRIDSTLEQVGSGFPHYADPETGTWTTSPTGDWTGGYWTGMLWLAYSRTGDERYRTAAEDWTERLRGRVGSETVFRGFLFWYGAALGHVLSGSHTAREMALAGADGFASLYNAKASVIPLGREAEEASDVGLNDANIDCAQGCALLDWAAQESGRDELREIGVSHVRTLIDFCLRDDGSVCQSARFDDKTGELMERYTHKGFSDGSTWTRAQAWAMLGFATAAARSEDPVFLKSARKATDWWLDHIPAGHVAYWDFDAPREPTTKRDTSGTAIAAAAMLKLAALLGGSDPTAGRRYRDAAADTAQALLDDYLTPTGPGDPRAAGILTEACYNHRIGLATQHELIWGSYYLYEALHVLAGHVDALEM